MRTGVLSFQSSVLENALAAHAALTGQPQPLVMMTPPALAARARDVPDHPYPLLAVDSFDDTTALRRLAGVLAGTVDTIASTHEAAQIPAAYLRALLGLPGDDLATAVAFADKHVQKLHLAEAGIPVAAHRLVFWPEDVVPAARELSCREVVVKPRLGFNGTNTHVVRNAADVSQLVRDGAFTAGVAAPEALAGQATYAGLASGPLGFLVESRISIAEEYHCETLTVDGATVYDIVGRYSQPCLDENSAGIAGGLLLTADDPAVGPVRAIAHAAREALGRRTGVTHAEVFHTTEGQWILGEIAARPGGLGIQPTIAHAYRNIDLPTILATLARGEHPRTVRPVANPGVFGWATVLSRPERLVRIAHPDTLTTDPRILFAELAQRPGTRGEPGSMPVATVLLRTDTVAEMDALIAGAADLFDAVWSSTPDRVST